MCKLTILLFFSLSQLMASSQSLKIFSDDEIKEAAKANLEGILGLAATDLNMFGFRSKDDFDKIQFGHPYQIASLSQEFYDDEKYIEDDRYVKYDDEWFVPLITDDTIRSFIFIHSNDTSLYSVGGGASYLASNIEFTERKYIISENYKRILLFADGIIGCDGLYLVSFNERYGNFEFYPILNSNNSNKIINLDIYQYYSSVESLFVASKTKLYPDGLGVVLKTLERGILTLADFGRKTIDIKIYNLQGQLIYRNPIFETIDLRAVLNKGGYLYILSFENKIFKGNFFID